MKLPETLTIAYPDCVAKFWFHYTGWSNIDCFPYRGCGIELVVEGSNWIYSEGLFSHLIDAINTAERLIKEHRPRYYYTKGNI